MPQLQTPTGHRTGLLRTTCTVRAALRCYHPGRTSGPHPWAAALSLLWRLSLKRWAMGSGRRPTLTPVCCRLTFSQCSEVTLCTDGTSARGSGMMPTTVRIPGSHGPRDDAT